MTCSRQSVHDLAYGFLEGPVARDVEAHVAECTACRSWMEGYRGEVDLWEEAFSMTASVAIPGAPARQAWIGRLTLVAAGLLPLTAVMVFLIFGRVNSVPDPVPAQDKPETPPEFAEALRRVVGTLVDGEPGTRPFQGESDYLRAALESSDRFKLGRTVPPEEFETARLEENDFIALCNVRSLTREKIEKLEQFVRGGGGLLISVGSRVDRDWYNEFLWKDGKGLLPGLLGDVAGNAPEDAKLVPARIQSFREAHPMFRRFSKGLAKAPRELVFTRYFRLEKFESEGVLAQLDDMFATPLWVEKGFGEGRVLLYNSTMDDAWNVQVPGRPPYAVMMTAACEHLGARPPERPAPQEDRELAQFRTLVREFEEATQAGRHALAVDLRARMMRELRKALDEYEAAVAAKDEEAQERTFSRLPGMIFYTCGEQRDPWCFQGTYLNPRLKMNWVKMISKLLTDDQEIKEKEHTAARKAMTDEMRGLGVPEGYASLTWTPLRDEDNATKEYEEVFRRVKEINQSDPRSEEFLDVQDRADASNRADQAAAHLKRYETLLEPLRAAATKKAARFPVDTSKGVEAPCPHVSSLIHTAKILRGIALGQSQEGRHAKAREACRILLALAACNQEDPSLISALVNCVILELARDTLQDVCVGEPPPAGDLEAFQKALDAIHPRAHFARAFQGEACSAVVSLDTLVLNGAKGSPFERELDSFFRRDLVELLKILRKSYELFAGSDPITGKDAEKVEFTVDDLPIFAGTFAPHVTLVLHQELAAEAKIRTMRAGLAAIAFRSARGRLPEKLEELAPEFLKEIPSDPFTGGPLLYREGRIYSVGPNGRDNGGENNDQEKDDIGFRAQ